MALSILDIEAHLQEDEPLPDAKRAELLFFRDAALRLISTHRDLRPDVLPLDVGTDPLMRFAVLELIRDMNQTQTGGGARYFGQDGTEMPMFTGGRPSLPPYVEGLLTPYLRRAASDGPVGCFPEANVWPAW